jgi:hypothetical protein
MVHTQQFRQLRSLEAKLSRHRRCDVASGHRPRFAQTPAQTHALKRIDCRLKPRIKERIRPLHTAAHRISHAAGRATLGPS